MNTHADKTQENKSQSVARAVKHKQSRSESSYQFIDNRPEAIAQRKLQEMANNHKKNSSQFLDNRPETITQRKRQEIANSSAQVKQAAQLKSTIDNNSSQQVIQMVRSVMREEGEIEEVEDTYELKPGEEFISDKLKNAEIKGHEAELARFRELGAAKEKGPIMDIRPISNGNSATLSHLNTPYVDKNMRPRSRLMYGVTTRFLTPTPDAEDDGGPKKRQISSEQVEKYKSIGQQAIAKEQETQDSHYTFYRQTVLRLRNLLNT